MPFLRVYVFGLILIELNILLNAIVLLNYQFKINRSFPRMKKQRRRRKLNETVTIKISISSKYNSNLIHTVVNEHNTAIMSRMQYQCVPCPPDSVVVEAVLVSPFFPMNYLHGVSGRSVLSVICVFYCGMHGASSTRRSTTRTSSTYIK